MSLLDHSHYRMAVRAGTLEHPQGALVVGTPSPVSSYASATGVEPLRIRTLRHHHRRIVGMYALQPVPEIPLSYADFLHLGPVPTTLEQSPSNTDVPALSPARLPQLV